MPQPPLAKALPMEARSLDELPEGAGWRYEPKWDGFRCLIRKHGKTISLTAKSGKQLSRYFPEVVSEIAALKADRFTIDGELLVRLKTGFSFEALQARLHPAESRILKLSRETPASFMAFDLLEIEGEDIRDQPLKVRHARLTSFAKNNHLTLSPGTTRRATAQGWLTKGGYEGVVAKELAKPYLSEERAMVKVKRRRTADCVVGGFRYATGSKLVGSLLLGLYDKAGKLDHVGFTSGFQGVDRAMLTKSLEALKGGPGFTGDGPGGPSRWSTERSAAWTPVQPRLVVEVSFDHASDGRFRHGTRLLRFRPDKAPRQCGREQLGEA